MTTNQPNLIATAYKSASPYLTAVAVYNGLPYVASKVAYLGYKTVEMLSVQEPDTQETGVVPYGQASSFPFKATLCVAGGALATLGMAIKFREPIKKTVKEIGSIGWNCAKKVAGFVVGHPQEIVSLATPSVLGGYFGGTYGAITAISVQAAAEMARRQVPSNESLQAQNQMLQAEKAQLTMQIQQLQQNVGELARAVGAKTDLCLQLQLQITLLDKKVRNLSEMDYRKKYFNLKQEFERLKVLYANQLAGSESEEEDQEEAQ